MLAEMARRRPNTELVTLDAGHSVHIDPPQAFVEVVSRFLNRVAAAPVSRAASAAGAGG
jgi:pimeloyl-ACP methyl ester carboxylesterase